MLSILTFCWEHHYDEFELWECRLVMSPDRFTATHSSAVHKVSIWKSWLYSVNVHLRVLKWRNVLFLQGSQCHAIIATGNEVGANSKKYPLSSSEESDVIWDTCTSCVSATRCSYVHPHRVINALTLCIYELFRDDDASGHPECAMLYLPPG